MYGTPSGPSREFTPDDPGFPENQPTVTVKLTGEDGNAFAIIGRVKTALKQAGQKEQAAAYVAEAFAAESYDELLQITMRYVEVE